MNPIVRYRNLGKSVAELAERECRGRTGTADRGHPRSAEAETIGDVLELTGDGDPPHLALVVESDGPPALAVGGWDDRASEPGVLERRCEDTTTEYESVLVVEDDRAV